jgi:hypothetical protein
MPVSSMDQYFFTIHIQVILIIVPPEPSETERTLKYIRDPASGAYFRTDLII